jgi:hypothetical protein
MCSVAAIIVLLGYMPPKGTIITVPASQIQQMTARQRSTAINCAKKHGILWEIDQGK